MADRFFPNDMPCFVAETTEQTQTTDSLPTLLSLPYQTLSSKLQVATFHLKQSVVRETWGSKHVKDYTLYTGALGTTYLIFKTYQVTKDKSDLNLCSEIIKACDSTSANSDHVTFLCGCGGVCALGVVIAKHAGDERLLDYYLRQFKEIAIPRDSPYELLYGRVSYLWACSFLNKHIGKDTIYPHGAYIFSVTTLKHGMNRFVFIVYRNAISAFTLALCA